MPRIVDDPVVLKTANYFEITEVHLYIGEAPRCLILLARSFKEGETVTPIDVISHEVVDAAMLQAMATVTTGGTIYAEIKTLLYDQLVADGIVPADAVEL